MERISAFVLGRKGLVTLLAVLAFLIGMGATPIAIQRLSEEYSHAGMPAFDANQEIVRLYGNGGYQRPFVPVVVLPEGTTATDQRAALRTPPACGCSPSRTRSIRPPPTR
ncbi:hypothetical protein AB0K48_46130, partial [Nonomuraea sp. NPDC055795]